MIAESINFIIQLVGVVLAVIFPIMMLAAAVTP